MYIIILLYIYEVFICVFQPLEVFSTKNGTDEPIQIKIRFVKELPPSDPQRLQLFGILTRKWFGALQLQQVGRNFFDPNAKVCFIPIDIVVVAL